MSRGFICQGDEGSLGACRILLWVRVSLPRGTGHLAGTESGSYTLSSTAGDLRVPGCVGPPGPRSSSWPCSLPAQLILVLARSRP